MAVRSPTVNRAAYWAFGQVIQGGVGIFATDSADVAAEKLNQRAASLLPASEAQELARNLSILARLAEDTVDDRRVLFASAQRFLEALAREQPTLVVLEDLHWADDGLLELLEGLSVRLGDVPLLLLALARPEFLDARPGWARLPINRHRAAPGAHRRPRSRPRAAAHIRCARQEAVAERIEEAAAGNPLFIEELAACLSEGDAAGAAGLPANVKTIIAARLDQLPAARATGDPRRVGDRRLLLAGHARSARKRRRARRDTARARARGVSSATALPRVSAVTRS